MAVFELLKRTKIQLRQFVFESSNILLWTLLLKQPSLDYEPEEARDAFGKKIGKKKLAKLQAKAEARAEREQVRWLL